MRGVSQQAANEVLQYTSVLKPSIASWSSLRIFLKFAGVRGRPSKKHITSMPQSPKTCVGTMAQPTLNADT